jgi:hypothetical protein
VELGVHLPLMQFGEELPSRRRPGDVDAVGREAFGSAELRSTSVERLSDPSPGCRNPLVCPAPLLPQQTPRPDLVSAHECRYPAEI